MSEESCRTLLINTKVSGLKQPQVVSVIKDSATIDQALKARRQNSAPHLGARGVLLTSTLSYRFWLKTRFFPLPWWLLETAMMPAHHRRYLPEKLETFWVRISKSCIDYQFCKQRRIWVQGFAVKGALEGSMPTTSPTVCCCQPASLKP